MPVDKRALDRDCYSMLSTFVDDMNYHIVNTEFDFTCWQVIHAKFLAWIKTLTDLELTHLHSQFPLLLHCISNTDKFKNFLSQLHPISRKGLLYQFLLDAIAHSSETSPYYHDDFYKSCADTLSLNFFKTNRKGEHIFYISQKAIPVELLPTKLQSYLHVLAQHPIDTLLFEFVIIDNSLAYKTIPKLIADSISSADALLNDMHRFELSSHINFLFEIKDKLAQLSSNTVIDLKLLINDSVKKDECLKVIKQWFPTPELSTLCVADAFTIVNFALDHLFILKANLDSTFLVGKFPKNVWDAKKLFKQISHKTTPVTTYEHSRRVCGNIENKALREDFYKLLDKVFILASHERVIFNNASHLPIAVGCMSNIGKLATLISAKDKPDPHIINTIFDDLLKTATLLEGRRGGLFNFIRKIIIQVKNLFRTRHDTIQLPDIDARSVIAQVSSLRNDLDKGPKPSPKLTIIKNIDGKGSPVSRVAYQPAFFHKQTCCSNFVAEDIGKIISFKPKKDDINGVKNNGEFSGYYTLQNKDGSLKTLLIKQGETLSEVLGYLEMQEAIKPEDFQHAAVTNFVLAKKSDDVNYNNIGEYIADFAERIYVASEFNPKSPVTIEAFKLALYTTRPLAADSLHGNKLFNGLIYMSNQCELGLGTALHNGFKSGDFDEHSGNIVLNFETAHITDNHQSVLAHDAILDLQNYIEQHSLSPARHLIKFRTDEMAQVHWDIMIQKIKRIQNLGGKVFFQKVDHGLCYHRYNKREGNLTTSSITSSDGFFRRGGSTNHQAEWTAGTRGPNLLDAQFCKVISEHSPQKMFKEKCAAAVKFFQHLQALAETECGKRTPRSFMVRLYLLESLYRHMVNPDFTFKYEKHTLEDKLDEIQESIGQFLIDNGRRIAQNHDRQYLKFLDQIQNKNSHHRQLEVVLRERIAHHDKDSTEFKFTLEPHHPVTDETQCALSNFQPV